MKRFIYPALAAVLSLAMASCLKEDTNYAEGTPNSIASVEVLRNLYRGTDVAITKDRLMEATKISGVVISDPANGNTPAGQIVLQNFGRGNVRGITIMLSESASSYTLGDSLIVEVVGSTLTRKQGTLQLTGITADKVTKVTSGVPVTARSIALSALAASFNNYESTLVEVNAGITPIPASGETYGGTKNLTDGSTADVKLYTATTATFATRRVPASAAFTGIACYANATGDGADSTTPKHIRMRSIDDVKNASGALYSGFPEDFESPDYTVKSSYNMTAINNNLDLKTGNWKLEQAILANTSGRDRFNPAGLQCIRMQQNLTVPGYVQMNFDLPNGASKVTLSYGAYYTDASSSWQLEYSIDGGANWTRTGNVISDANATAKVATFLMDITVPVRFRVVKLGLGTTNGTSILNGRLSIEDIAVYQN